MNVILIYIQIQISENQQDVLQYQKHFCPYYIDKNIFELITFMKYEIIYFYGNNIL